MKLILIVATLVFLGCTHTTGKDPSSEELSKINMGKSTYGEVKELFGEPTFQQQTANDAGYYSEKCGKRGETIRIAYYSQLSASPGLFGFGSSVKMSGKLLFFNLHDIACDVRDHSGGI